MSLKQPVQQTQALGYQMPGLKEVRFSTLGNARVLVIRLLFSKNFFVLTMQRRKLANGVHYAYVVLIDVCQSSWADVCTYIGTRKSIKMVSV